VRCKVACLRWAQQRSRPMERARSDDLTEEGLEAVEEARLLHRMARDHLQRSRVRLVLVGGLPGTGKSTLAGGLADCLDADVLRSDEVRKEQAGLPTDQPAPAPYRSDLYAPETTEATYGILAQRATIALSLGRTVILDASWTDRHHREMVKDVAARTSSELVELRCVVGDHLANARMATRRWRGGDPSDATAAVAAAMASAADPWPSASVVDTSGPSEASLRLALQLLGDTDDTGDAGDPGVPLRWG